MKQNNGRREFIKTSGLLAGVPVFINPFTDWLNQDNSDEIQDPGTGLSHLRCEYLVNPLGIDWTHMNVELLEMTAYSLIQAMATGKKIKTLSKEEVKNLDNVVQKRDCPMFGAPRVHQSLVDLYF